MAIFLLVALVDAVRPHFILIDLLLEEYEDSLLLARLSKLVVIFTQLKQLSCAHFRLLCLGPAL